MKRSFWKYEEKTITAKFEKKYFVREKLKTLKWSYCVLAVEDRIASQFPEGGGWWMGELLLIVYWSSKQGDSNTTALVVRQAITSCGARGTTRKLIRKTLGKSWIYPLLKKTGWESGERKQGINRKRMTVNRLISGIMSQFNVSAILVVYVCGFGAIRATHSYSHIDAENYVSLNIAPLGQPLRIDFTWIGFHFLSYSDHLLF